MSATSDKFEQDIAKAINSIPGCVASRPTAATGYADVHITKFNKAACDVWLEVKMNHTDNLSNPRVFYKDGKWQTTYKTPAAIESCNELNESSEAKQFVKDLALFAGIPYNKIYIPTTQSGLREPNAVPLKTMKVFVETINTNKRYIMKKENYNIGELVTKHYTVGKTAPAYYMQAADDFYMISNKNPLKLSKKIPLLSGYGTFKVRVATRSEFYEIQSEIKIMKMPTSTFSCKKDSTKTNPFI